MSELFPGQSSLALQEASTSPQLHSSLSNWKSTVSMMFSNPSPMNLETANVLSSLLVKAGFVEGAHICHLLFGTGSFGSQPGNKASFDLLGSDPSLSGGFGRDTDSILLSMVMEYYKFSMEPSPSATPYCPHMILYKLNLISYLVDRGNTLEAEAFFDCITSIVKAAGKNLNYSSGLIDYMELVAQRLNLTNQDGTSSSWLSGKIGRPKLDKVLGHLDKSFSKFVTGDDVIAPKSPMEQDGIFKRLAETPMALRTQSTIDIAGMAKLYGPPTRANPYSPVDSDTFQKNPYNPQAVPSRSQSTVGFDSKNLFNPPQPYFAHEARSYSPSQGTSRGNFENISVESMIRPKSSSTTRSHGSSVTKDISDTQYPASHFSLVEQYNSPTTSRSHSVYDTHESQVHSIAPTDSSTLKDTVATTSVPVNPYSPVGINPYGPPSNAQSTKSPYSPYAPQAASTSSLIHSKAQEVSSLPAAFDNSSNKDSAKAYSPYAEPSSLDYVYPGAVSSAVHSPVLHPSVSMPLQPEADMEYKQHDDSEHEVAEPIEPPVAPTYNPYNPYSPAPLQDETRKSSPYAPVSNSGNIYAPVANVQQHENDKYAPTPFNSSGISDPAPADGPSYSEFNPYGSVYDYNAGDNSKSNDPSHESIVNNEQHATHEDGPQGSDTGVHNTEYGQYSYPSYEPPQYGYRTDEVDESEPPVTESNPISSGEVFAPMSAPTYMPSTYYSSGIDSPMNEVSTQANTVMEEDEDEIEDLGFSNNSMKKKEDSDSSKVEEEKKQATNTKEKKSGWFSWMRKGGDDKSVKATQIKFGDEMSLVYDPVLKRYVNKNAPKEDLKPEPALPPPPPMGGNSSMPPMGGASNMPPMSGASGMPPASNIQVSNSTLAQPPISGGPPSGPNPARAMPSLSSGPGGGLDDLLAAAPAASGSGRKTVRRNARSRYVDIMSQTQQNQ